MSFCGDVLNLNISGYDGEADAEDDHDASLHESAVDARLLAVLARLVCDDVSGVAVLTYVGLA